MNQHATLPRRTPMKRTSSLRRSYLRSRGKRAEREREELEAFRADPPRNCERCNCYADRLHAHHILPRSRGGKHVPENRAFLCFSCHSQTHSHSIQDWENWIK